MSSALSGFDSERHSIEMDYGQFSDISTMRGNRLLEFIIYTFYLRIHTLWLTKNHESGNVIF